MDENDFDDMCSCARVAEKRYAAGDSIFNPGDVTRSLGIVLEGSVIIENYDLWGNTAVLSKAVAGEVFAEAYALCGKPMPVAAVAAEACRVAMLDVRAVLDNASAGCPWRAKLLRNLLEISAEKNMILSSRIFCTSSKSVRGKLLTYLSQQSVRAGSSEFRIPFNRQQMADYLNVDRSALSKELCRMRDEGLIDFRKNSFAIHAQL